MAAKKAATKTDATKAKKTGRKVEVKDLDAKKNPKGALFNNTTGALIA